MIEMTILHFAALAVVVRAVTAQTMGNLVRGTNEGRPLPLVTAEIVLIPNPTPISKIPVSLVKLGACLSCLQIS